MRPAATLPALFLLAVTVLVPSAQATANICSIFSPAPPVPTPFLVPPPYPNALAGPCTVIPFGLPAAATGTVFTSGAPPCPPPIGPAPGELCGPAVAPLQTITCTATIPGGANPEAVGLTGIVLGVDFNGDGNVLQPAPPLGFEPLRHNSVPLPVPTISTQFTNTSPLTGRVIAYPIAQMPVMVGCL
jgi:hypothetical protein